MFSNYIVFIIFSLIKTCYFYTKIKYQFNTKYPNNIITLY